MLMHRPQTPQPGFGSITLLEKFTPHFKILDPRLLGLLKRISYLLPLETRITLYNNLMRPLFDYGVTIWGDKGNATLKSELQLLLNKAAKIILSLPCFYSSTEALKELCWPTLFKHRLFHRCVFVFKYVNGIIDFRFDSKRISDIHSYNTRGKSNFYLPRVSRNFGKQRLLYQGIEWNSHYVT